MSTLDVTVNGRTINLPKIGENGVLEYGKDGLHVTVVPPEKWREHRLSLKGLYTIELYGPWDRQFGPTGFGSTIEQAAQMFEKQVNDRLAAMSIVTKKA